MTDSRMDMLNRVGDQIAALLPPGVKIERIGAIHNGYDDGATLVCGESRGTVIIWAYGRGEMPNIEAQTVSIAQALLAREEVRLADIRARDDTVARFY